MIKQWTKMFQRRVFIKYILTGMLVTAGEMALLYALVNWFAWWYIWASSSALFLGILFSFVLRKFLVFKNRDWSQTLPQLAYYILIFLLVIILNGALMYLLVELPAVNYLWAQVIANIILGLVSFTLNRFITFKPLIRAGAVWAQSGEKDGESEPPGAAF